jgi:hypothetical protein
VKEIPLTKGYVALVDDEDYERVSVLKWSACVHDRRVYAMRRPDRKTVYLHRFIMNAPVGSTVDHQNHDGLDNRRENLRICSNAENVANQRPQIRPKSSTFKGVTWDKSRSKWIAVIKVNKVGKHLGRFSNEMEAARAYDRAAFHYFGQFAHPNFERSAA